MAKKKADYVAQGYADARDGKPRAAICAATWQAAAYDSGYDDAVREAQAAIVNSNLSKGTLKDAFRLGMNQASRKAFKDGTRRAAAMVARITRRQELRGMRAA